VVPSVSESGTLDVDEMWRRLESEIARCPFHQLLSVEPVRADPASGQVEIELANRKELGLAYGSDAVHGGVLAALVDIAGHAAVACRVGHAVPTIDLCVDYLRPAQGERLTATATPIQVGRSIGRASVEIRDQRGALIVVGRAAYRT